MVIISYSVLRLWVLIMNTAQRLKELRKISNLSVYKLAQISEVSATYIHEIERGEKQPSIPIVEKLCKAFGIEVSDFFITNSSIMPDPKLQELINIASTLSIEQLNALIHTAKAMKH